MHKEEIYHAIISTTAASRTLLVDYVCAVATEAHELPESALLARSGEAQFREPQKPGELLMADLFHALIMQNNLNDDLENICDIAQELMVETDSRKLWKEFFDAVSVLNNPRQD